MAVLPAPTAQPPAARDGAAAPPTVLNLQNAFSQSVQGKQINLGATYTDEFVKAAAQ